MSTTDTVFLIITACSLSLFFLLGAVLMIVSLTIVKRVKSVIVKAEDAIDSVGEATEVIKNIGRDADGPLAALKVIRNIVKMVNRNK